MSWAEDGNSKQAIAEVSSAWNAIAEPLPAQRISGPKELRLPGIEADILTAGGGGGAGFSDGGSGGNGGGELATDGGGCGTQHGRAATQSAGCGG